MAKLSLWLITLAKDRPSPSSTTRCGSATHCSAYGRGSCGLCTWTRWRARQLDMGSAESTHAVERGWAAPRTRSIRRPRYPPTRSRKARLLARGRGRARRRAAARRPRRWRRARAARRRRPIRARRCARNIAHVLDHARARRTRGRAHAARDACRDWLVEPRRPSGRSRRSLGRPRSVPLGARVPGGPRAGGFDAIVGNPPFQGGKKITGALGTQYRDYLVSGSPRVRGNADLVAYFYLRAARAASCRAAASA